MESYADAGVGFAPDYLVVPGGKAGAAALTSPPPRLALTIPNRPYITHLLLHAPDTLVFGTSDDDAIRILHPEQAALSGPGGGAASVRTLRWALPDARGEKGITALISAPAAAPSHGALYTPSKNGRIAIWDLREGSGTSGSEGPALQLVGRGVPSLAAQGGGDARPAPSAQGSRHGAAASSAGKGGPAYLSAAASENGFLIAAGTELRGTDAIIDVWDIRSTNAPLFSYSESHSDDVSALAFCPASSAATPEASAGAANRTSLLLSGSTDGLLSIFNTAVAAGDEDDAVVRVQNLGASLARVGWGGVDPSAVSSTSGEGEVAMEVEGDADADDEAARELAAKTPKGLGGVWGVTDMQTLSVLDADTFDNTTLSGFPARSRTSLMPAFEPDYIIDAWSPTRLASSTLGCDQSSAHIHGMTLWEGDANGNFALVHVPSAAVLPSQSGGGVDVHGRPSKAEPWEFGAYFRAGPRAHEDIVRCVEYDAKSQVLITGGEDGKICFWALSNDSGSDQSIHQGVGNGMDDLGAGGNETKPTYGSTTYPGAMRPHSSPNGNGARAPGVAGAAQRGGSSVGRAKKEKALLGHGHGHHGEAGKGRYRPF